MARLAILVASLIVLLTPAPSRALFHLAHISEVMSGVNGDPSVQYVEIRMNSAAIPQSAVGNTRLTAFNCDGTTSSVLLLVPTNVTNFGLDVHWIMATTSFAAVAGITPDFTWDPASTGNIDPTCGMVCWGAPGILPPANPAMWSATDQNQYVDCVGYGGYTGARKTSTHDTTPTSGTPTPLTAGNGTMSLTRVGFTGDNNADFALAAPTPTNNNGRTGFGGGSTTTTVVGGSTTSTTTVGGSSTTTLPSPLPGGGCTDVATCRAALAAALPNKGSASSGKSRKVAGKLAKLDAAAGKALDKASGKKQAKQDRKARAALTKLLATATAADRAGTLGVPLAPIQNAVNVLLAQIP
jgi:hypothetical protein